jgi:hypothetical protein
MTSVAHNFVSRFGRFVSCVYQEPVVLQEVYTDDRRDKVCHYKLSFEPPFTTHIQVYLDWPVSIDLRPVGRNHIIIFVLSSRSIPEGMCVGRRPYPQGKKNSQKCL